jgi:hypothetical protein
MNVITKFNQFASNNCDVALTNIDGTVLTPTVSLCHQCHQHIPAYTYHKDNQLWLSKSCVLHGVSHHMIERDYNFLTTLNPDKSKFETNCVLFEVSDKCNADCPHCYHMPDNKIVDKSVDEIVNQIAKWYRPGTGLMLAGAEASLHKDFILLIKQIVDTFKWHELLVMTNGIRFADIDFLSSCKQAGLYGLCIGLNHPSYLDNKTIRNKQITAIENANTLGMPLAYISYTMSSISELEDILEETTSSNWNPVMFRIRYGSDIGRYPEQERMYVSDIYKITKDWCAKHNKTFELANWDDNIYHVMVKIDGQLFRLIQWCDETDIHMEELRSGPYCNFTSDGLTNFLHQVIRRDIETNKKMTLPDHPPVRYQLYSNDVSELDFSKLY